MPAAMLVLGLGAVIAALLLVALVVLPAGRKVPLARLDPAFAPPPSSSALAGAGAAAGAAVEKVLRRRGRLSSGAELLERAGMTTAFPDYVLVVGLVTLGATVLGALLGGPLLAVLAVLVVPLGARLHLSFKTSRRQAAFADQLDDALQLMASSLRAGHSVLRAIDAVSQEAASPMAEEFARIVTETRMGRDLGASLDEVGERMQSDDFAWIAQAIAIQREVGGNLAEVLGNTVTTMRQRAELRGVVRVLTAEGRISAKILMSLPFFLAAFMLAFRRSYITPLIHSGVGWAMIAVGAVMLVIGGTWLNRLTKIEV